MKKMSLLLALVFALSLIAFADPVPPLTSAYVQGQVSAGTNALGSPTNFEIRQCVVSISDNSGHLYTSSISPLMYYWIEVPNANINEGYHVGIECRPPKNPNGYYIFAGPEDINLLPGETRTINFLAYYASQ